MSSRKRMENEQSSTYILFIFLSPIESLRKELCVIASRSLDFYAKITEISQNYVNILKE